MPHTPDSPKQTDTSQPPPESSTTVALLNPYWVDEFEPNVKGAPERITRTPQPVDPKLVDKLRKAAADQNLTLTVKGD